MEIWPSPRLSSFFFEEKKRDTSHNRSSSQNLNRERRYAAIFCNFFCVVSAHAVEKYISNGTISSIGTRSIRKRGYERTIFVVFARNFFWPLHEKRLNVHRKCPGIGRMRKHASRFRAINVTFECVYVCWDAHVCWLLCLCISESGAFEMQFWTQKWEKKREFSFTAFTRLIYGSYTHLYFFLFLN